jgi:hypothetical protein
VKNNREKEKVIRKLKVSLNQQPSRQPYAFARGALRWLRARSAEGCGRGVLKGFDFFPSSYLIFSFESVEKKGKEKIARTEC